MTVRHTFRHNICLFRYARFPTAIMLRSQYRCYTKRYHNCLSRESNRFDDRQACGKKCDQLHLFYDIFFNIIRSNFLLKHKPMITIVFNNDVCNSNNDITRNRIEKSDHLEYDSNLFGPLLVYLIGFVYEISLQ